MARAENIPALNRIKQHLFDFVRAEGVLESEIRSEKNINISDWKNNETDYEVGKLLSSINMTEKDFYDFFQYCIENRHA
jgi:hypothetical protein